MSRAEYERRRYADQQARARAALTAPPRARSHDVPRRCPDCGAAVMLTPRGAYFDDKTGERHRCRKATT